MSIVTRSSGRCGRIVAMADGAIDVWKVVAGEEDGDVMS